MTEPPHSYLSEQWFSTPYEEWFPTPYEHHIPGGHPQQQCYSLSQGFQPKSAEPPTFEMKQQNHVEPTSRTFEGTRRTLTKREKRLLISSMRRDVCFAVLCFPPIGIVARKKASKVQPLLMAGDLDGALQMATSAKKWYLASLLCAMIIWLIVAAILFLVDFPQLEENGVNFETSTTV